MTTWPPEIERNSGTSVPSGDVSAAGPQNQVGCECAKKEEDCVFVTRPVALQEAWVTLRARHQRIHRPLLMTLQVKQLYGDLTQISSRQSLLINFLYEVQHGRDLAILYLAAGLD